MGEGLKTRHANREAVIGVCESHGFDFIVPASSPFGE